MFSFGFAPNKHASNVNHRLIEEFIILLNHASHIEAIKVTEEIMHDIREQTIEYKASAIDDYLTVSIGLCLFSGEQRVTESELLKLADDALYQAKKMDVIKLSSLSQIPII